ncbi:Pentatricopeptide repeat [Macleaya cordata]|uniref:Pentatricopeptide repeat n=1 Tax=Macleaya cordata TaxID=56857 RepID=A0A200PUF1_MACCD|nr:Pentatricopeptide repeat [Macleaya cordata]
MKKSGFPLLSLGNKLIDAYIKCEAIDDGRTLFDEMTTRHIVTWNSMISTYIRQKRIGEAIKLYEEMILDGIIADEFTYSSVFKAFSDLGLLQEGRKAHGRLLVSGLSVSNVFVGSALVDMYAKFGKLTDARLVSDEIVEKDVVLMTALIVGYTQNGEDFEALKIFRDMIKDGIRANDFTFASVLIACGNLADMNIGKQIHGLLVKSVSEFAVASRTSLLTMYSKCGLIDDSLKVFDRFFNANLVTWTALIMGLVQNGREESALSIFCQMIRNSMTPNAFTLSTVLRACSILAMLTEGQEIHGLVLKMGLDRNRFVGAALIDMYGKCGIIKMASSIFNNLNELDVVSVNSMIYGYAQSGNGEEAVKLYDQMPGLGVKPNDGTFVSVLSACSNAGLLEEGRRIFSSIKNNHEIELSSDHYACMVDLLGRAGKLEEAERLINQVKNPDVVLWRTLLSSCKIHGDVEMAKRIMNRVIELKPGDEGAHILLSNIYASTGNWNEVTKMKVMMKDMKLKKNPAMSWIEVDGEVHKFMAGDLSHPRSMDIDEELKRLSEKIEGLGYVPDARFVLQDLDEKDKERSLYYHSEKLAIAFGLLSSSNRSTCIRIFKNLRVCGDCHNWIKFVSRVVGREIIARDAKRFHHFRDGFCSCGDFW